MMLHEIRDLSLTLEAFAEQSSLATRAARTMVTRGLGALAEGRLEIREQGVTRTYGQAAPDGPQASVVIVNERAWLRVALAGSLGLAESYMEGWIELPDIVSFVRLFARNRAALAAMETGFARLGMAAARRVYQGRGNTERGGSRQNIAEHYDLGNEFFALMLDPTMTYSAGYFPTPTATMQEASLAKLARLGDKLALGPGDHLLEIGTGWGSMAVFAAKTYGCRVTTTTISREQRQYAQAWVAREGLADRVTVLEQDYRHLTGQFDKVVSIEMVEAVGHQYLPVYMATVARLLRPGGRFAMQAITIADALFDKVAGEADFIKRYIFPGSCIPSVEALARAAKPTPLELVDLDDQTWHYQRTMAAWRETLAPHQAEVVAMRGEYFWRMWNYYLQYCEGGFAERYIRSTQLVFERAATGGA